MTPYNVYSWNQTTHQGNVEKGRICSMASVSHWYGSQQRYTIRPTIEYANKFGKHDVSGLFLYEYAREDYEGISAGRILQEKRFPKNRRKISSAETFHPQLKDS